MCLLKDKKVRNNHHKENGYCVAYKIINENNRAPFMRDFKYKVGENPANPAYKVGEIPVFQAHPSRDGLRDFAFYGLHLMLSLEETKDFVVSHFSDEFTLFNAKIIKVYYKPEDVIAYGYAIDAAFYNAKKNGRSVVVKSCLVKSLEPLEPII